jgi:hypothetical protein
MSREKLELERKDKAKSMKIIESGSSEKGSINNGGNPIKAPGQREVDDGLDKLHDGILTERMGLKNRQGLRLRSESVSLPVHSSQTCDAGDAYSEATSRLWPLRRGQTKATRYHHDSEHRVSRETKVDRVRQLTKVDAVTSPLLMATGGDAQERTLVGEREIAFGKMHKLETRQNL